MWKGAGLRRGGASNYGLLIQWGADRGPLRDDAGRDADDEHWESRSHDGEQIKMIRNFGVERWPS